MTGHRPEVADVFRSFSEEYLEKYHLSRQQKKVLHDMACCKTAALGGHKARCEDCGHEEFFYNSCRNRHCPKCQGAARAEWLAERQSELLDVPYFHVVFTLPDELGPLALQNKRLLYGLLFRAAKETLLTIARDPKHLGADIGFLAILHTWGQKLDHHPHVHCVVPGGGLSRDKKSWVPSRPRFFLPVKVLSRLFRGKFLDHLRCAYRSGELEFHGKLRDLGQRSNWARFLRCLKKTDWVVYCQPPFGSPDQVLKYLARYTHRVAISNQRLLSLEAGKVTFTYKDYRRGNDRRTITLDATEFMRRFLQHVLPSGFQRIRYYGFLANRFRRDRLKLLRDLIPGSDYGASDPQVLTPDTDTEQEQETSRCPVCPRCKKGQLFFVEELSPRLASLYSPAPMAIDSS